MRVAMCEYCSRRTAGQLVTITLVKGHCSICGKVLK